MRFDAPPQMKLLCPNQRMLLRDHHHMKLASLFEIRLAAPAPMNHALQPLVIVFIPHHPITATAEPLEIVLDTPPHILSSP